MHIKISNVILTLLNVITSLSTGSFKHHGGIEATELVYKLVQILQEEYQ